MKSIWLTVAGVVAAFALGASFLVLVKHTRPAAPPRLTNAQIAALLSPKTTALMIACSDNDLEGVRACIAKGDPVNASDEGGDNALCIAASSQNFQIVQLLVANGADVNAVVSNGRTALIFAIGTLRSDIVELLLKAGADPNAKDQRGNTPLTLAIVAGGSPELVKLLLKYGADPNLKGTNERSPVLNADKRGSDEIVSILREAGAKGW